MQDHNLREHAPTRRSVLQAGAVGLALGALPAFTAPARAATLVAHDEIWDVPTYYEIDGLRKTWSYDPTFYSRMETWMSYWYNNTPLNWLKPLRLYGYGAYVNKPGAHGEGRAFDLSRIYATINGTLTKVFDGRYDLWRDDASITTVRKRYWGTCAGLNYHFRNVLHYAYNSDHWNHIHIDNMVSGSGNSNFATTSQAQVKNVQACCTYIWGYPTTVDGIWGSQTDTNSRKVLTRIGRSGGLTTSQTNWLQFNHASMRFGNGTQTY